MDAILRFGTLFELMIQHAIAGIIEPEEESAQVGFHQELAKVHLGAKNMTYKSKLAKKVAAETTQQLQECKATIQQLEQQL